MIDRILSLYEKKFNLATLPHPVFYQIYYSILQESYKDEILSLFFFVSKAVCVIQSSEFTWMKGHRLTLAPKDPKFECSEIAFNMVCICQDESNIMCFNL